MNVKQATIDSVNARAIARAVLSRPGICAIVALGIAWGLLMHAVGWAQQSFYAQERALANGQSQIDPWKWQAKDEAWVDHHFYSVKAPGLATLTLPVYLALDAVNAQSLARRAADNALQTAHEHWHPYLPRRWVGFSAQRARRVPDQVAQYTPMVWALTLFGSVLPAIALLLLVRWAGERVEAGFGTAAAVTLGLGTIVMTFASEYFSHVASAALGFGAFALLMREREGPPRLGLVTLAGLLAGLAVCFEYPLGLLGFVLFGYALARPGRLRRGVAFAVAAVAGAVPALIYNLWSLGSPFRFAYSHAVAVPGRSGHAVLGLNSSGFFGIGAPSPGAAADLLLSSRGLLTLTPVLVMGIVGAVLLYRRGRRAEAGVIAAVTAVFLLYNASYWEPLGGTTPGPRFLIPVLPFLALGLASAYRRYPALTLGLAIPSALTMLVGTLTYPLLGDNGTAIWVSWLAQGSLEHTVLTAFGVTNAWLAVLPVLAAVVAAVAFAARATPRLPLGSVGVALWALLAWSAISIVGPTIAGDPVTPLHRGHGALALVGVAAAASALALLVLRRRQVARGPERERRLPFEPALGEPSS
jgi:hypothetical protein